MENINFIRATMVDLDTVSKVCEDVINFMQNELKIEQWTKDYPKRENFEADIQKGELFLMTSHENEIIGFICINKELHEPYNQVTWEEDSNFKVLHRVAINPRYHKQGYGKKLYSLALAEVKKQHIPYVRVDTFSQNIPMNNLIKKMGFKFLGQMNLKKNKPPWNCYEIKLYE